MTKAEMLQKLNTNEPEWNSYLAKASKFFKDDLTPGERDLHKRIYSNTLTTLFGQTTPEDIQRLFDTHDNLVGVILAGNICGKS